MILMIKFSERKWNRASRRWYSDSIYDTSLFWRPAANLGGWNMSSSAVITASRQKFSNVRWRWFKCNLTGGGRATISSVLQNDPNLNATLQSPPAYMGPLIVVEWWESELTYNQRSHWLNFVIWVLPKDIQFVNRERGILQFRQLK